MVSTKKMRGRHNIQRGGFEMPDFTGYFGNVTSTANDFLEKAKKSTGYSNSTDPIASADPIASDPIASDETIAQEHHMGGRKSRKSRKSRKGRKHTTKSKKRKSKGRGKRSRRTRRGRR